MTILDRIILAATGAIALYAIVWLFQRKPTKGSLVRAKYYHMTSLTVLLVSGLLLILFGWNILGLMGESISNRLIAVVASLIPFAWAAGLVTQLTPVHERWYLPMLGLGLVLITVSRFLDAPVFTRIVYPLFHGTAGVTIILGPFLALKKGSIKKEYLLVSAGGFLISTGGMALSFLLNGRQFLFFSLELVLMILAPILLLTAGLYTAGLVMGSRFED
jgi:hypothetical protein